MSHKRLYRALRAVKQRGHEHDVERAYRLSMLMGWSNVAFSSWYYNVQESL